MHTTITLSWNPYDSVEGRILTFASSPSTSNPARAFGEAETFFLDRNLPASEIPVMYRIALTKKEDQDPDAPRNGGGFHARQFSSLRDPCRGIHCKTVTFLPTRPCDVPLWDLDCSGLVDRLTPGLHPVAHAGDLDPKYYGLIMGGLPNTADKKLAALSILSKLSGESIGLVGCHRFSEDGFVQPHTGGHLTFFYVRGAIAAANVRKWSKCLLVCEDEIVVVLNSEGEPEQAEKILRTIIPTHPDGTPFHKMGHPCPIEEKKKAPERRFPLASVKAAPAPVPVPAPRPTAAPTPNIPPAPCKRQGQWRGRKANPEEGSHRR